MYQIIETIVTGIKHHNPLILNITNDVTMDFIANGLLSLGASPIMTRAIDELEELLSISRAVVINIGTLDDAFIKRCTVVCRIANRLNVPITLDPVGAGASHYRTKACLHLLEHFDIAIIRGNASEIMALSGAHQNTKGVDASISTDRAIEGAQYLSKTYAAVVVMSGATDVVVDLTRVASFKRGSPLMPRITGSGCLLSAVVSVFDAVHSHRYEAVSAAVVFYGVCGEISARQAHAPGSFKTQFIDALSYLPQHDDY